MQPDPTLAKRLAALAIETLAQQTVDPDTQPGGKHHTETVPPAPVFPDLGNGNTSALTIDGGYQYDPTADLSDREREGGSE